MVLECNISHCSNSLLIIYKFSFLRAIIKYSYNFYSRLVQKSTFLIGII